MKKILVGLILLISTLTSCYKDQSAPNFDMIDPIIINLGSEAASTSYWLFQLDTLSIMPVVYRNGQKDTDFSYKWTIYGNYLVPEVIGTNMTLKKVMNYTPYNSAYRILFEARDNSTGVLVEQIFYVTIVSPFGAGLIVADTHDEQSGDISLVVALNFKSNNPRDTIMKNLFSRFHERKVEAPVTAMLTTKYGAIDASMLIATKQSIERINPYDYSYLDRNGEMFTTPPEKIEILNVASSANNGHDYINNGGKIHYRAYQFGGKKFGYPIKTYNFSDYTISKICKPYWYDGIVFDKLNGRFLVLFSKNLRLDSIPIATGGSFAYNQFKDYDCLSIFPGLSKSIYCIVKHKISGEVSNYVFSTDTKGTTTAKALKFFEYKKEKCPEIESAISFTATEATNNVYYATDRYIYCINGTNNTSILTTKEYEVPEGEVITDILAWTHYRMTGTTFYTNPDPNAVPEKKVLSTSAKNRMLVISIYNPLKKEGFIRTIAISNAAKGTLEKDSKLHGEFAGFGRITSISTQE